MFARFFRALRPVKKNTLELKFLIDVDADGHHRVTVLKKTVGDWEKVDDIRKLLSYGYQEYYEVENKKLLFVLGKEDIQSLLSLRSMNPIIDGRDLVFEIDPSFLIYLRGKNNLSETPSAQEVKITREPLAPTARISYDPSNGIKIETGYQVDGENRLRKFEELILSKDGQFARLGKSFQPLKTLSEKARQILSHPETLIGKSQIPEFIQRDLVLIKNEFNAVLTDKVSEIRVFEGPYKPVVRIHKDNRGWLSFNVLYTVKDFELPHKLLDNLKNEKFQKIGDTTFFSINKDVIATTERGINELGAIEDEEGYRLPVHEFANLEEFIQAIGGRSELSQAYQEFLDQISGFKADEGYLFSEGLEGTLVSQNRIPRPYQRAGVHWLCWLRRNYLHGVLADDMGLGKTLQALCALRLAYEDEKSSQHSLIIAPKSVLIHWERELHRTFPLAPAYIYHGSFRKKPILQSKCAYIFITTYDIVMRDITDFSRIPFFYLVLDEATKIKNPDARRTLAIKSLNALHRLALSGTPVENRPAELWSLFDFLMRGHLGKHGTFVRTYEQAIMEGDHTRSELLGKRIKPFFLRRKKEDVAKDLPQKIIMTEWCELSDEQKRLYGTLQDQAKLYRSQLLRGEYVNYAANILPVLTHLKQICDHPALVGQDPNPLFERSEKFDWIMDKIDEIIENKEQVAVFSHFLGMLSLIESGLIEKSIKYIRIDGSTNNRQQLIDFFNESKAQVALLSLTAAGHGITLTGANHVIHADRWWNPAVEDQATDRVHRIGQVKTVYVYHILTQGTIEEKINNLLEEKRGMSDQILGAASEGPRQWTKEELMEILKPIE